MKIIPALKSFIASDYLSARELSTFPDMRMTECSRTPHPDDHALMGKVNIDNSACNGCELCVDVCPGNALKMIGGNAVAMVGDSAGCVGCGACVAICLPDVIQISRFQQYDGRYRFVGRGEASRPRRF